MSFRFSPLGHNLPLVAVLLVYALVLLTSLPFWFSPDLTEEGDMASNALQVERAREGRELLGPYSRFGFSHPGPIAFYGQAVAEPLFAWLPSLLARHLAGQLALNLIFIVWVLRLLKRAGLAPPVMVAGVFLLAAPLVFLGGGTMFMLANIWGPLIVVFPMLLFVVGIARATAGDLEGLPAASLGATISYQTHLLTIPVLFVGFAALAGVILIRQMRPIFTPRGNQGRIHLFSSVVILILGAIPILIEQINGHPGNLTLLWRFVRDNDSTTQAWSTVFHHLGQAFTDPLVVLLGDGGFDWNAPVIVLIVVGLLGIISVVQFCRSQWPWRRVILAAWVAVAVIFTGGRHVHDELYTYLFYYLYGLVGLLYLIVGKEIWDRLPVRLTDQNRRAEIVALGAAFAVFVPWLAFHRIDTPPPVDRFATTVDHFGLDDVREIHLAVGDGPEDNVLWTHVPTYALRFRRVGVHVTVEDRYVILCGEEMRPREGATPPLTLVFTKQAPPDSAASYLPIDDWGVRVTGSVQ